ncbi:PIR protein,putative [Plasmodium sp.]|nr:PIR protein,putative [Plasmodium sp.]
MNDCDQLYKNINYKVIVEVTNNFRTLGELSYEPLTNYTHENNILSEYGNTNETKYKKNIYTKDPTKRNPPIREVTEKVNTSTINLNKYRKGIYNNHKEAKSNKTSRSIKYLEMQRNLYNNFYAKPEIDLHNNFSDKSNNKSCECENKKSSYNINDKYLDNLKTGCAGSACVFSISSGATEIVAIAEISKASKLTVSSVAAGSTLSYCCAIAALVLFIIAVVLLILYIWLCRKR